MRTSGRALMMDRKNHYGFKSLCSIEVAAFFYSLVETARLFDEDLRYYLLRTALAATENLGTVTFPASTV
ncbi:hypothetical protein [Melittangium boletus]|uniref:Uncharacterized protein n=1 Tax=Melittangium boletus DSM 14713 TaxID=1294270 RepID=A0A250IBU6_9BACT|nr:hypothetical protein [Melittangium boletus]ATB28621.1 hypothetical protein MEBOL_002070 [Melittangium boletus DSM 14713]